MVSNNRDKKMIIFVETCDEVDYLKLLLSEMKHNKGSGEGTGVNTSYSEYGTKDRYKKYGDKKDKQEKQSIE